MTVVFSHAMLTWPALADAVNNVERAPAFSWEWWVTYTPLHAFWIGSEAVYVFFILSGFVLTGPVLKSGFRWAAYYRKRLLRLYLPVWASLAVAAFAVVLVPRAVSPGLSSWVNHHQGAGLLDVLIEAILLLPVDDHLNGPLWSLTWEVWFSLLLPIYIIVARWTRARKGRVLWLVPILFGIMGSSVFTTGALRFLPMFALGVLMFMYRDSLRSIGRWLDSRRGAWPCLAVLCVLLLTSLWVLQTTGAVPAAIVSASRLIQIAGAAVAIFIALCWSPVKRVLETSILQWLGSRSFSLYLTHDPIVSTVAIVLGPGAPPFLVLLIALPLALVMGELFFRLLEKPSHKLANFVGRTRWERAT